MRNESKNKKTFWIIFIILVLIIAEVAHYISFNNFYICGRFGNCGEIAPMGLFFLIALLFFIFILRHFKNWGLMGQKYFIKESKRIGMDSEQFEGKFFLFILRALIIFASIVMTGMFFSVLFGPIYLNSTGKQPVTQESYESSVVAGCKKMQEEQTSDYLKFKACNGDTKCTGGVTIMTDPRTKDSLSSCITTWILNDEMNDDVKSFAQQTMLSNFIKQSKVLSNSELESKLNEGLTTLLSQYDTNTGLWVSANYREYENRNLSSTTIDQMRDSVLTKYGPCWGIPEGQCRE